MGLVLGLAPWADWPGLTEAETKFKPLKYLGLGLPEIPSSPDLLSFLIFDPKHCTYLDGYFWCVTWIQILYTVYW